MLTTKKMTATNLRLILSIAIILVAILSAVGFTLLSGMLKDFAGEVSKVAGEAQASDKNIQLLQKTQAELEKYKDTAIRAESIVSDSTSYQYQEQITRDLNSYAEKAGLTISGFSFDTAAATAPAPAASTTPQAAAPQAAGINSKTVTIQLDQSIPYESLLTFMNLIEQNLTKMQVAKISLSKASDDANNVAGQALAIEVYVR